MIRLDEITQDQIEYLESIELSTLDLDSLCGDCDKPFRDHIIGGPGKFCPVSD